MKRLTLLCMVVALAVLPAACARQQGDKAAAGGHLAKVGSAVITAEDVNRELAALPEQIQGMFEGPAGVERFVDELVKKEVLYQEAKKKGLEDNAEYKKKVEEFKKLTLITVLLEKEIEDKAKVTEKDAHDYYDKHKAEFAANSQVKASHILLKTEDEAKKVLEQVRKGGDFAKLAKEKSIDTGSAKNGGDLGFFSRGQMVPEFEKAAFALKKGEMSEPVKTQYGFHIIKVTDRKEGTPIEFEKIKQPLTQKLTAEKQKELFDGYITTLKGTYKPEVSKEAIEKFTSASKSEPAKPAAEAGREQKK